MSAGEFVWLPMTWRWSQLAGDWVRFLLHFLRRQSSTYLRSNSAMEGNGANWDWLQLSCQQHFTLNIPQIPKSFHQLKNIRHRAQLIN